MTFIIKEKIYKHLISSLDKGEIRSMYLKKILTIQLKKNLIHKYTPTWTSQQ